MYLSTYQIDCIFNCYEEKYRGIRTDAQITEMAEREVNDIEDSNDYKSASAFVNKAATIPTKGMLKDLEILNHFREWESRVKKTKYEPIEEKEFRFRRSELETILKKYRIVIRNHVPITERQKEVLIKMGINPEIVHLVPRNKYEEIYDTLKGINVAEMDEIDRNSWLFADGDDEARKAKREAEELEF